ncbi:MAG: RNA polymerase sigma-70 factor [Bacteroidota bacterium]
MSDYQLLSDLKLSDLLKEDDESAFTEIYSRYADKLTGFASSKLYDLEDARDIIHDVFVKLWAQRNAIMVERNLEAYLFTLVRYQIIDKIRKNITREAHMEMVIALQTSPGSEIEQQLAAKELKEQIRLALDQLSPRIREIYQLSREENRSIPEIAALLHLSEQTVKNQLSFALKHLRACLGYLTVATVILTFLF